MCHLTRPHPDPVAPKRFGRRRGVRSLIVAAVCVAALVAGVAPAGAADGAAGEGVGLAEPPAGTTPTTTPGGPAPGALRDLDLAREALAAARGNANVSASQYHDAEARLDDIRGRMDELSAAIDDLRYKEGVLRAELQERLRSAYSNKSSAKLGETIAPSDDLRRRNGYLKAISNFTASLSRKLDAIGDALDTQRETLRDEAASYDNVRTQYQARYGSLTQRRAMIRSATEALIATIDTVLPAAGPELTVALTAERTELAATLAVATGDVGQIIAGRTSGPIQCPVAGTAYSDDYMLGRLHPGIDMMADTGSPAVAVRAGTVEFVPGEGAGGNAAYLNADDGNVYYYAHFSSYVGPGRAVAQGEVIGLVGMTGNATAPHLHFEIRLGSANGSRVNPFSTLVAAGC